MIKRELGVSVLEAAERRVVDAFEKNKYLGLAFSGGKDSITLSDIVINTMQKYNIAFSRLFVYFFDEEAIYPDVEQLVLQWRSKFLSLGAKFFWFCLPIRHYNCCNRLANDESFICWQPGEEANWIRPMPKFAIRNHTLFKMGMSYQEFSKSIFKNIPQMIGLRINESIQRCSAVGKTKKGSGKDGRQIFIYPIYDWADSDIWLYIQQRGLQIPMTYIYLFKVGVPLNKLRISQFFSVDTIKTLPKIVEFYPNLFEAILRREPNADLVLLYWDTDMFRSGKQDARFSEEKDYKTLLKETMKQAAQHPDLYAGYTAAKRLFGLLNEERHSNKIYQRVYQILVAGDPKKRTYRAVVGDIKKTMN